VYVMTVSRLVWLKDSGMSGHSLQKYLASPIFATVVKLNHPLALCIKSMLKV